MQKRLLQDKSLAQSFMQQVPEWDHLIEWIGLDVVCLERLL